MIQYVLGALITLSATLAGISIKLWADVQILKTWKKEHVDLHKQDHEDRKQVDSEIFKKFDYLIQLVSEIKGNCKGKQSC